MNPVTSWRDQALRLDTPDRPFVLTHPQPNFAYPAFPGLTADEQKNPLETLRNHLTQGSTERAHVYRDLSSALKAWLGTLDPQKKILVTTGAPTPELLAVTRPTTFELRELPREPQDFADALEGRAETEIAGIALSNPHRLDGFFLPTELNLDLHRKIRSALREVPLLVDESLGLFSFNQVAPGSLRDLLPVDPKLTLLGSIYPAMSPQGPETSWLLEGANHPTGKLDSQLVRPPDPNEVTAALKAFRAFESRQGKAVAEFSRRMLAVDRALKTFGVHVQQLVTLGKLRVPLWPETGFHLVIELAGDGPRPGFEVEDFCLGLFRQTGVLVIPGSLFDRPRQIAVNFAANIDFMDEAGKRLVAFFEPQK